MQGDGPRMISLYPQAAAETFATLDGVTTESRPIPSDRCWVMSNMIATADGGTAIDGLSGPLGRPADTEMLLALRSMSDAILVGAATARDEQYRPPGPGSADAATGRERRGQSDRPVIVLVTASLSIDRDHPLFGDPTYRPVVATVATAPADRRAELEPVADILIAGEERVDLRQLLTALHQRGHKLVLSEGGPSLNGQLIADDLIDEWNLTLSPLLAAGSSRRPAVGSELNHPVAPMRLARVWLDDELLFCRWLRDDESPD